MKQEFGIGLMGLGVVGGGVFRALWDKGEELSGRVGARLKLCRVLVRHPDKPRSVAPDPALLTTDYRDIVDDPEIDIVVELIGGETPAAEYIRGALLRGKHVVTANKEVIAKHGRELLALARERGVALRWEASVGGGIPLISPLLHDLRGNRVHAIRAIINGTTNYILTRMAEEGLDFALALKEAQELGYAEPNPSNDIEGLDAAYKLAILAGIAFETPVHPRDIYHEGIGRLSARDFRYARELGYAIKLLAIAREHGDGIEARVHPVFIPEDSLLARVRGAYNAVEVEGDLVGRLIFYGMGAGSLPTTSAVLGDILSIVQDLKHGVAPEVDLKWGETKPVKPLSRLVTRYYLRMWVDDRPGVLAQIARVLGDLDISIASVIQKESDPTAGTAEIVIMTHPAVEASMAQALKEMGRLGVVKEVSSFIRVEA